MTKALMELARALPKCIVDPWKWQTPQQTPQRAKKKAKLLKLSFRQRSPNEQSPVKTVWQKVSSKGHPTRINKTSIAPLAEQSTSMMSNIDSSRHAGIYDAHVSRPRWSYLQLPMLILSTPKLGLVSCLVHSYLTLSCSLEASGTSLNEPRWTRITLIQHIKCFL